MSTDGKLTHRCGLTLRRYSPSDPTRIQARADFAREQALAGDPLMGLDQPGGLCWTLAAGPGKWDRPLACGGLESLGHGRWSGWLYASDLTPRGWAMVARAFRLMIVETKARRVEMAVNAAPLPGLGWAAHGYAEALGLVREGTMRGWGPDGSDYVLYAGVFE